MAEEREIDIKILYLCIHKRLYDTVGLDKTLTRKQFYLILGRYYHVPKLLKRFIMKEMQNYGMIEIVGQIRSYSIKVNPLIVDPEENLEEFNKELGLWGE